MNHKAREKPPVKSTSRKLHGGQSATIIDVARLAGVSSMTVSRSLRDPDKVAPATREKVQSAIDELNYIPDLTAGTLSNRKSSMIAVILPSLFFEGHARTISTLSRSLREDGYHILLGDNGYARSEERELIRLILGRRPAGIVIINSVHSQQGRRMLSASGIPVVEAWHLPDNPLDCVVGFSHQEVGEALTRHLVERGHRRIGFIGRDVTDDPRGQERLAGFTRCMQSHCLPAERVVLLDDCKDDIQTGREGLLNLRKAYPDTDAILCLTDRIAMGALMECRRQSVQVPDDMAIVGHGNFDFSEHLAPSLTSSRIDAEVIGEHTAALLLARINGRRIKKADRRVDVGFAIEARESSATGAA